jgi:AcrR family transcriptional regulator
MLRERQRQVREDAILEVAHERMMDQGYDDMSMDDVAARVGISKATLYQHFASKEDLAINVIVRAMRQGEAFINSLDPALPAIERLEYLVRHAIEHRVSLGPARLILPPSIVLQHPRFQAQASRLISTIGTVVDAAKAEGAIAPQLATSVVVHTLLSCMREHSYVDLVATGECTARQLSDMVVLMLFGGLRTHGPELPASPGDVTA